MMFYEFDLNNRYHVAFCLVCSNNVGSSISMHLPLGERNQFVLDEFLKFVEFHQDCEKRWEKHKARKLQESQGTKNHKESCRSETEKRTGEQPRSSQGYS